MKQSDTDENQSQETKQKSGRRFGAENRGMEPGASHGPSEKRGRAEEGQDQGRESGDLGNEPREESGNESDEERERTGNH